MPSGAKKRKAAKKKKEQHSNPSNSNSPLGHDDSKSQDERESDGGEAGSPASQDHHNHQHPFKEGNGEFEERDPTPAQSFDPENKSMDEVVRGLEGAHKGVEDDGAVNIEGELKSEEDSGSQSISIKHVEFLKESHDGNSSSSSSDNESQVVEKTMVEVGSLASQDHHVHQHPFKDGSGEFEKEDPTPAQSFDPENKYMDEVVRGLEDAPKGVENDGAVNIEGELKSEEDLGQGSQSISIKNVEVLNESCDGSSSSSSSDDVSQVVEKTMVEVASQNGENKPVDSFPKEVIQGTEKAPLGVTDISLVETVKPLVTESEEVIHVTQVYSVEISVVSDVAESLKENEESKRNEEKVIPLAGENVGASSNVETVTNENEGKNFPTSVTPTAETINGGESLRDSKIPDSSENQPLVSPAPRVEQRTSWMSCCGLFDVLNGSSR